jgi:uncharacterized membrane protein SpoIIM required for sporulation
MAVFMAAYAAGAAIPLGEEEAEEIRTSFLADIESIDQSGIFLNNIEIALAMFVPGVGAGVGIFSGVSTGVVFNAFALVTPELQGVPPLSVLVTPFGMLEVFGYGLAMSRSAILAIQLAKKSERKNWRQFTIATGIEVGVVIAVLLAGSLIEAQEIA